MNKEITGNKYPNIDFEKLFKDHSIGISETFVN